MELIIAATTPRIINVTNQESDLFCFSNLNFLLLKKHISEHCEHNPVLMLVL